MATRIKLRRGTAVQWATTNPVLSLGEFGYESNTARFKIGDGETPWNSLAYNEQIITLTGDATGSGNSLINVTVINDSHNHTTATLPNFTEDVQDVVGGMVVGNTENGIVVTYDDTNGKLDFDVNDPVITIDGDVYGQATITNLSNTTIMTTIQPDSVALGTDTTGDYVKTITGTTNQVNVAGAGTESRDVTLSLPQNIHSMATPTFDALYLNTTKFISNAAVVVDNDVAAVLSSFDVDEYTSADYFIQMKQDNLITSLKSLVVWDGDDVLFNQYSIIHGTTGPVNAVVNAQYNALSGRVEIVATSPDADIESIDVMCAATLIYSGIAAP